MGRSRAPFAAAPAVIVVALGACASFAPELGPIQSVSADAGQPAGDGAAASGDGALDAAIGDASGDDGASGDVAAGDASTGADSSTVEAGPTTWTVLVGANGTHSFAPASLSIHAGDTVHWVWQASGHTVTSGQGGVADGVFCSPADTGCTNGQTSGAGTTYDHVFAKGGAYPYFCRAHWSDGMVGTITVQ